MFAFLVLYCITDMPFTDRYVVPFMLFAFPCLVFFIKENTIQWKNVTRYFYLITIFCLIISGICSYKIYFIPNKNNNSDLIKIADYLKDNGYSYGYGTFWDSNILTEFSNGQLEMHNWIDCVGDCSSMKNVNNINNIHEWLQISNHATEKPSGKVFMILSNNEYDNVGWWKQDLHDNDLIYKTDNYRIFGYDSYDDMLDILGNYSFDFNSNQYIQRGIDLDLQRRVYPGGLSFGPYMTLYSGKYNVTITGKDLTGLNFYCTYNNGLENINIKNLQKTKQQIMFEISTNIDLDNAEVVINNTENTTKILNSIEIQRMK